MTFMDQQLLRQAGSPEISPDGAWMLYTLSVPNWKEAKRYTDIFVVSTKDGLPSTRQLTFTRDKSENSPQWSRDGSFFVFSSNRDAAANANTQQLYMMRPNGGEAERITDVKDGVGSFAFSKDGKWLVFAAGKNDEQQLMVLPVVGMDSSKARPLTKHATPIGWWRLSADSKTLYFVAQDSVDKADKERMAKLFTVKIRNQDIPLRHLWSLDIATGSEKRLTQGDAYSIEGVSLSNDASYVLGDRPF